MWLRRRVGVWLAEPRTTSSREAHVPVLSRVRAPPPVAGGSVVAVKRNVLVRPRSTRPAVGGGHDGALVVRVREPATDGRANRAVVEAVAGALGVARGAVRITAGASSRRKVVEVDGDETSLASVWAGCWPTGERGPTAATIRGGRSGAASSANRSADSALTEGRVRATAASTSSPRHPAVASVDRPVEGELGGPLGDEGEVGRA